MTSPATPASAPVPADIEREDRLLLGLTARQLLILGVGGIAAWLAHQATSPWLGLPASLAAATPVAVAALGLALGQRDGLSLDRLALAAVRFARIPRQQVPTPDRVLPPPAWATLTPSPQLPAPMTGPVAGFSEPGIVDLGPDGTALICAATTVNLRLRTPAEQQALAAAFARWLHAITTPVQILTRADRQDLTHTITALRQAAPALPHPALETAALQHADYLAELATRRDVLRQDVLVVFRDPSPAAAAAGLVARRAEDAAGLLAGAGISLTALDAAAAAEVLGRAADPERPARARGLAAPHAVITGRT